MAESKSKKPATKKATAKPAKSGTVDAKASVKKATTKKAAPAAIASKAPAPRKSRENEAPAMNLFVSDEERYRMIAEAAYFRAESSQFKSDPVRNWIEAERDIAILLGEDQ
ncbi:MAG: DUF2934 domain-containing protein [Azoarcus sp.]|jgi:hypothetical protein|nr:DUF2934 domain-containing protein [Azoarcus sp.]